MTSIGLISDVHATVAPVAEAFSIFEKAGVDAIFCAGDIAGYRDELEQVIELLEKKDCRSILGNHDVLYLDHYGDDSDDRAVDYFKGLPTVIENTIDGKCIYMVHAHPPDACHGGIKLLDRFGELQSEHVAYWSDQLKPFDYDVLIVGHTHQVFTQYLGDILVVNPGSSAFNHSCAILHLPEMRVQTFALSGKAIERAWNWGEHMIVRR